MAKRKRSTPSCRARAKLNAACRTISGWCRHGFACPQSSCTAPHSKGFTSKVTTKLNVRVEVRVGFDMQAGVGRHLAGAEAEDELLHGLQALQAELQADVEEQEHDAQLGQVPHALHVSDDACRQITVLFCSAHGKFSSARGWGAAGMTSQAVEHGAAPECACCAMRAAACALRQAQSQRFRRARGGMASNFV